MRAFVVAMLTVALVTAAFPATYTAAALPATVEACGSVTPVTGTCATIAGYRLRGTLDNGTIPDLAADDGTSIQVREGFDAATPNRYASRVILNWTVTRGSWVVTWSCGVRADTDLPPLEMTQALTLIIVGTVVWSNATVCGGSTTNCGVSPCRHNAHNVTATVAVTTNTRLSLYLIAQVTVTATGLVRLYLDYADATLVPTVGGSGHGIVYAIFILALPLGALVYVAFLIRRRRHGSPPTQGG